MNEQAGELVNAALKGSIGTAVMVGIIFALTHYGAFAIDFAAGKLNAFVAWLKGKGNELSFLAQTTLDDRFFDLLAKAVSNQAHLKAALAESVADGSISPQDLQDLLAAVWNDFRSNLGVADWRGFALLMLGNESAPREISEQALKRKFDANVHSLLGATAEKVATRRMEVRAVKARELLAQRELRRTGSTPQLEQA
jgi:hypothetical protein